MRPLFRHPTGLLVTVAVAAVGLLASALPPAQDGEVQFDWHQRLGHAAYVYNCTNFDNYFVNEKRDMWLAHANTPDADGRIHDSQGHYQVTLVAGPLWTPFEICDAYSNLDPAKGLPPAGWAGVDFICSAMPPGGKAAGPPVGEVIKTAATNAIRGAGPGALIVALVNGVRVAALVLKGAGAATGGTAGGTTPPTTRTARRTRRRKYTIEVQTQDKRTRLDVDGEDTLGIRARVHCTDRKVDTSLLTRTLVFCAEGKNATWLRIGAPHQHGKFRSVEISAAPPADDAELKTPGATLAVAATIEGETISAPVMLTLRDNNYQLEVEAHVVHHEPTPTEG